MATRQAPDMTFDRSSLRLPAGASASVGSFCRGMGLGSTLRCTAALSATPQSKGGDLTKGDDMLFDKVFTGNGDSPQKSSVHVGKTDFRKQLRWLIKSPPEGSVKMVVTPAMASEMLHYNTGNRPLSAGTVARYARAMSEGRWIYTAQTIAFSEDGHLNNGQHRLHAVCKSGTSIEVDVRFGEPREAFAYTDTGKTRGAGDIFAIHGEHNYMALASATRWVWRYENSGMRSFTDREPDHEGLHQYLCNECPGLREYAKKSSTFQQTGWGVPTPMVALNYLCGKHSKSRAEDFFDQVCSGNGIGSSKANHPIIRLRKRLNEDLVSAARGTGLAPIYKMAFIAKAWNAWRADRPLGPLQWRGEQHPDEPFPRIK